MKTGLEIGDQAFENVLFANVLLVPGKRVVACNYVFPNRHSTEIDNC